MTPEHCSIVRCYCAHIHYTIAVRVPFSHVRSMQNRVEATAATEEAVSCRRVRGRPRAEAVPVYSVHHVHCLWVPTSVVASWTL